MNAAAIRKIRQVQPSLTFLLDILAINLSVSIAFYVRFDLFTEWFGMSLFPANIRGSMTLIIHIVASVVWSLTFYFFELYDRKRFSASRALLGAFFGFWMLISLTFFKYNFAFSRLTGLLTWFFTTLFTVGWRALFSIYLNTPSGMRLKQRETIIVGDLVDIKSFFEEVKRFLLSGYHVIGIFVKDHHYPDGLEGIPILGRLDDLGRFLNQTDAVDTVIFTKKSVPYTFILNLQSECRQKSFHFRIIPDTVDFLSGNVNIMQIDDIPMIDLVLDPTHVWDPPIKRFIDISMASLALILVSPIFILTMIAVKLTSKGPIFYRQERVGQGGKPFILYKFRSMVENAEMASGPVWAAPDDDRYTRIGKFLRKSSIDELPQLWNILRGDMSLVGPRPERLHFVNQFEDLQYHRLMVKPGLTGLAQVNGRYHLTIEEKTRYDLYYVRHQSLLLDLDILLKTIWITLSQKGAY